MSPSVCYSSLLRNALNALAVLWLVQNPIALFPKNPPKSTPVQSAIVRNYGALPLNFEPNQGQTDSRVRFLSRGSGYSILFKDHEAILLLSSPRSKHELAHHDSGRARRNTGPESGKTEQLQMRLLHGENSPVLTGENRLPGIVNYFVGNDPSKWHVQIPTFAQVKYAGVYPGVDLVYYGSRGRLEFDFEVAPGADASAVQLRFDGARTIVIDANGNLVVIAQNGNVSFQKPVIYQMVGENGRRLVNGSFRITAHNTVSFALGNYDRTRPLIIDPILDYSTYIGPASYAAGVAVDAAGEAYFAGNTQIGFPTTPGSFQPNPANPRYVGVYPFVAKLNSTGTAMVYCTYITGTGDEVANGMAIDGAGDAYVVGGTNSTDFPVTAGALQTKNSSGNGVGFVSELNSAGSGLIFSTYLGGTTESQAVAITADSSHDAYVIGMTYDSDFPTTPGAFQTKPMTKQAPSSPSGYVAKINPTGTTLMYSSYLAGSFDDVATGIAVDSSGNAYIGGFTRSTDFPTTPGAFQLVNKAGDSGTGFVTKVNSTGSALVYSTYLGGSFTDSIYGIVIDGSGNAYVTGNTYSADFPTTPGVFQPAIGTYNGNTVVNSFVTKLNSSGSGLVYSTFLGGGFNGLSGIGEDHGTGIALDSQGNAIVVGSSGSIDFPVTAGAFEPQNLALLYSNDWGSFVTKINPTATSILYSTFLSGTGDQSSEGCDCAVGVALDPSANVYVVGSTVSVDFPVTLGVLETPFTTTAYLFFITKLDESEMRTLPATSVSLISSANPQEYGKPVTFTAKVQQTSGSTPTGTISFSISGLEDSDEGGYGLGPWSTVDLDGSGSATLTTSSLASNPSASFPTTVVAYYLGDVNNAPSSGSMSQLITQIPTTITLTSSANPAVYGAPLSFTATVLDNAGKPVPGQVDFMINQTFYGGGSLDSSGQFTWVTGSGASYFPVGTETVTAEYSDYTAGEPYQSNSANVAETITALGVTPAPTFTPPAGNYTSDQNVVLGDANSAASVYYTTDGSTPVVGNSNLFTSSSPIQIAKNETVQAIAIAPGYTASAVASAAYTINAPPPTVVISGTSVAVSPGATTGNTSTITVSPSGGFTGSVALTAAITSSPAGAQFPPTLSFGSTSSVTISGTDSGTATLTISTTAPTSAAAVHPKRPGIPWYAAGTATLACVLLFGIPGERRRWQKTLRILMLLVAFAGGVLACGGGAGSGTGGGGTSNPGTTAGIYIVTVTGTSGTVTGTGTVNLTVQ